MTRVTQTRAIRRTTTSMTKMTRAEWCWTTASVLQVANKNCTTWRAISGRLGKEIRSKTKSSNTKLNVTFYVLNNVKIFI